MPGYIPKALKRFGHEPPPKLQDQLYPHAPPNYWAKLQYSKAIDNSPPLSNGDKIFSMQVTGPFLLYSREIDSTMLPASSAISSEQNPPTEKHNETVQTIPWLFCIPRGGNHHVQRQWYGTGNSFQCILPFQKYCTHSRRWLPFTFKWWIKSPKQRRRPQPINNHMQRNITISRGRSWSVILEYQNISSRAQETWRARPSATTNAHPDGQQNSRRTHQ